MSSRLRADVALCWARTTLMRVPFFMGGDIEDEFLASAALSLRSAVYCRSEYVPVEHLLVVERGIAAKAGRIKTRGACLGEDMMLADETFKDVDPVGRRALACAPPSTRPAVPVAEASHFMHSVARRRSRSPSSCRSR
jgi:hypothetical protein